MNAYEHAKLYFYKGRSRSLKEWAKIKGVKVNVLYRRINVLKWSFSKVMEEKVS